jgi:putative lipoprotein
MRRHAGDQRNVATQTVTALLLCAAGATSQVACSERAQVPEPNPQQAPADIAASPESTTATPSISEAKGVAMYRERVALPPEAVFEATLEDVSRADAPSQVLGRARIEPAGQPPFRFSIKYDAARLQPNRNYAIRARLTHEDRLLFTTDRNYPVPPPGQEIDMLLVRAPASAPAETSTATLVNTYWKLVRLGDEAVEVKDDQREPYFVLHSEEQRVGGYSGCNRLTGSYAVSEDTLSFSQIGGTMMACAEGMELERAFLDTLGKVARFRIEGETLEVFDTSGASLALFESRYLR